jgi:hypothetical protein
MRQKKLVDYWARVFELPEDRVHHVLLIPEQLKRDRPGLRWPVVTWQQVLDLYRIVGDGYWLGVLHLALQNYSDLASPEPSFRSNAEAMMTGGAIVSGAPPSRAIAS